MLIQLGPLVLMPIETKNIFQIFAVSVLQLDCLTLPANEFIMYLPPVLPDKLALTGNPQLMKYDLVNILQ